MTNKEILEIALTQSAYDLSCTPEDLMNGKRTVVISEPNEKARKYLTLPFICNIVTYGSGVVASTTAEHSSTVQKYIDSYDVCHLFETPNLHVLNDYFEKYNCRVCFMAEYFLPDMNRLKKPDCSYQIRLIEKDEISELYKPEWSNALCEKRKELDVLAFGAFDGGELVGLAGCSADSDTMWQIGVDVKNGYRRQGIASALTSHIALKTLEIDKVPFYCAAWSNIASVRNAIRSGFRPSWAEMTVKENNFVANMNNLPI